MSLDYFESGELRIVSSDFTITRFTGTVFVVLDEWSSIELIRVLTCRGIEQWGQDWIRNFTKRLA